jgi:hypothetical protein
MRKIAIAMTLALSLAAPAAAVGQEPSPSDFKNAAKYCKALRAAAGAQNFRAMFGGGDNAYGKCVSKFARDEAAERRAARKNAARQCKEERAMPEADFRAAHNGQSFAEFYGTGNGSNAYGKCVSRHAKENKQEADERDENRISAAEQCRAERAQSDDDFRAGHNGQTFGEHYGRNENDRNAFGKCVSQHARAMNQGGS